MRAQVLNGLAKKLGVEVPKVASVQQQLGKGHAVLVYLPARSGTHCFVVTHDRVGYHRLADTALTIRDGIQKFVVRLRSSCTRIDPEKKAAARLAAGLRALGILIAARVMPDAVRDDLEGQQHVTVIGSELLHGPISGDADAGLLNYLPIECLPWDTKQLFGQRFAVDHNVSLPVWCHLAKRVEQFTSDSELSIFGTLRRPGVAAAKADKLAGRRIRAIRKPLANGAEKLDAACTLQAVLDEAKRVGQAGAARRIALFLAHGGYDASSARGSFLQLHDGRLDCETAQGLGSVEQPFADLVLLAACRAAKAPTRAGDQLANLGGAFLLAGAEAVVQSRFDLTLYSTQALLAEMMRALAAGESPAEAMRRARRAGGKRDPLDAYRTGLLQVHGCGQLPRRD